MSSPVQVVDVRTTMDDIGEIFSENSFHHLPVLEGNVVVGMISKLDFNMVLDRFTIFNTKNASRSNRSFLGAMLAKDVMSQPIRTIVENESLESAVEIFLENRFHALPVLNSQGNLVGIVTTHDLLKFYAERIYGAAK